MRKIITALILVLALCSCGKVTKTWVWKGEKEIPAKGGTAICTKIELVSEDRATESHIFLRNRERNCKVYGIKSQENSIKFPLPSSRIQHHI